MYQNTYALWANTTSVSIYNLLQCYWIRSNIMHTNYLNGYYAPINPTVDISTLSISNPTIATLIPNYYFWQFDYPPVQSLTLVGDAISQGIINVTEQIETKGFSYQLTPGPNAVPGAYDIYVCDNYNNKSLFPITINIIE
jgi:hypothetical protein